MKKLPKPLYHGTTCTKAKSIKKFGLSKDCSPVHEESVSGVSDEDIEGGAVDPLDSGFPRRKWTCGVYLTRDRETAKLYAYDASKKCDPEWLEVCDADTNDMCIVTVKCLAKGAKLGPDGYGELMTNKDVPPECIKVTKVKEWW